MRTDLPLWPNPMPWRVLHSFYVDALAERPHLGALPRDMLGFLAAVTAGTLGVTGTVTRDGLAYVVTRRLGGDVATVPVTARAMDTVSGPGVRVHRPITGATKRAPLCRVTAKELGLSRKVLADETARVELMSASVPDDLSGLDGPL